MQRLAGLLVLTAAGGAHADATFTLTPALSPPDSRGFQNSVQGGTLTIGTITSSPARNFVDTWNFTLAANAQIGSIVSTVNFLGPGGLITQGIDNLQLRLVGPTSTLVGWTNVLGGPTFQNVISYVDPDGVWDVGTYRIEIRGQLTGLAAAYGGTVIALPAPVPLPASMPLLLLGMIGMTAFVRMRNRRED